MVTLFEKGYGVDNENTEGLLGDWRSDFGTVFFDAGRCREVCCLPSYCIKQKGIVANALCWEKQGSRGSKNSLVPRRLDKGSRHGV
jgi:hypothetical protein